MIFLLLSESLKTDVATSTRVPCFYANLVKAWGLVVGIFGWETFLL